MGLYFLQLLLETKGESPFFIDDDNSSFLVSTLDFRLNLGHFAPETRNMNHPC